MNGLDKEYQEVTVVLDVSHAFDFFVVCLASRNTKVTPAGTERVLPQFTFYSLDRNLALFKNQRLRMRLGLEQVCERIPYGDVARQKKEADSAVPGWRYAVTRFDKAQIFHSGHADIFNLQVQVYGSLPVLVLWGRGT